MTFDKEIAIQKITEMSVERVSKLLIFMAGMEAEHIINEKKSDEKSMILGNSDSENHLNV